MIRVKVSGWLNAYRTRAGVWLRGQGLFSLDPRMNVQAVLRNPFGERSLFLGHNLITTAGELHYAELISQETPTNAFGVAELATATPTQSASDDRSDYTIQSGSEKAVSASYPRRDDGEALNTGAGADVFSYKYEWDTSDGNWTGLDGGIITNESPGASEPILTGFDFSAPVDKNSSQALTVYVNHAVTGV